MKLTKIAVTISVLAWATAAQAHVKVQNLWPEYNRQQKWEDVNVEAEGVQGQLRGFITEDKSVQIDQASGSFRTQAALNSTQWGIFRTRAAFARDCHLMSASMDRQRSKRNSYSLTLKVVPLGASVVTVTRRNGQKEQLQGPANKIELPGYYTVDVSSKADAMIKDTGLDIEQLKTEMLTQLGRQQQAITGSGELVFDLAGFDDVVCDLLRGRISISLSIATRNVRPKLVRSSLFQVAEMERLQGELSKRTADLGSGADPRVLNPAYLALGLITLGRDMDQLDAWEFDRLYGILFDRSTGRNLNMSNQSLAAAASQMDRLSTQKTSGKMTYAVDVTGEQ